MERITDYREFLSRPIARLFLHKLVESISTYPEDFDIVYNMINDPEPKISWRAAWTCQKIFDIYPNSLEGKQEELIAMAMKNTHSGTRRIILSILLEMPTVQPLRVDFLDFCFNHMFDLNQAIAIQALCIKMAYKLCLTEPELLTELKLYLENAELQYYSIGVKTCARNILKRLN